MGVGAQSAAGASTRRHQQAHTPVTHLLRIEEVFVQGVLAPHHRLLLVGLAVAAGPGRKREYKTSKQRPGTQAATQLVLLGCGCGCALMLLLLPTASTQAHLKPSAWPDCRPKRPPRLGPCLWPSPGVAVWHCAPAAGKAARRAAAGQRSGWAGQAIFDRRGCCYMNKNDRYQAAAPPGPNTSKTAAVQHMAACTLTLGLEDFGACSSGWAGKGRRGKSSHNSKV